MKLKAKGIVSAKGFKAAGEFIGIKKYKKDLAVIYSETPCVYAGAFTTNVVKAAPVLWDQEILSEEMPVHGVVINSGNANAVTGQKGYKDTVAMAELVAEQFEIKKEEVLVCSTGVIGVPLPMGVIADGIGIVCSKIDDTEEAATNAAQAILTTDTFIKEIAIGGVIGDVEVTLGAIGKGSGMIHPNMATMLAFICTDVSITQEMLQKALSKCVNKTFNMITVDGDTSTNDSVIVLANGEAGNKIIQFEDKNFYKFCEMLEETLKYIAISIVKDGEGATKLLEVQIDEVESFKKGKTLAKSILTSNLVKTAFFGEDANWGRILAAMGYSGENFDTEKVELVIESTKGAIQLFKYGNPITFNEELAKEILGEREIKVRVCMNEGEESVTAWGCDLSYDYVKINGEYRS